MITFDLNEVRSHAQLDMIGSALNVFQAQKTPSAVDLTVLELLRKANDTIPKVERGQAGSINCTSTLNDLFKHAVAEMRLAFDIEPEKEVARLFAIFNEGLNQHDVYLPALILLEQKVQDGVVTIDVTRPMVVTPSEYKMRSDIKWMQQENPNTQYLTVRTTITNLGGTHD